MRGSIATLGALVTAFAWDKGCFSFGCHGHKLVRRKGALLCFTISATLFSQVHTTPPIERQVIES